MDIVRVTLIGCGYDVARGIVTKKDYNRIKNSTSLDNIWIKGLYKKLGKQWGGIKQEFHDYGITNGDIIITVNNEELINLPVNVLNSCSFSDGDLVDLEGYNYPITDDVVVTSIQELKGTFMDVVFVTDEEFNFNKFKFIEKEIQDENEGTIISSLISEVYYDGELISFTGDNTELRMSRINFDTGEKKFQKNEKNNNRRI
jgi:hypothetical protein